MGRRRASKGSGLNIIYLVAFLAVVFIVIPAVLTFAAYAEVFCIIAGLLFFEIKTADKPSIRNATEFYSAEDCSAVDALRNQEEGLRKKRENIYILGCRQGLELRRHEQTLFDERKLLARKLNIALAKLNAEYSELASQVHDRKGAVRNRRDSWLNDFKIGFERWRFYSSGRLAFRIALCSYLIIAATLLLINPVWVQNLSITVSHYVWFPAVALSTAYGAIVIASGIAAAVCALAWRVNFQRLNSFPSGGDERYGDSEFHKKWGHNDNDESVDEFMSSYWTIDTGSDEEYNKQNDYDKERRAPEGQRRPWFEVLGVSPDASLKDITAARNDLLQIFHPDRFEGAKPSVRARASEQSTEVNVAFDEARARSGIDGRSD